ncbi:MAG: hypothetical protein WCV92_02665 [Candidatus Buchananbacteria bacterium]
MEGGSPKRFNSSSEFDPKTYDELNHNDGSGNEKRSKKEKINTIAIVLVGILAVFLGFYEVVNGISNPFFFIKDDISNSNASTSLVATDLNNTDTDSDGISDYNEIYIYKTSPYLEDSDGDGIKDNDEIKNGTDANCPQGQKCAGLFNIGSSTSSTVPVFSALPDSASKSIDPATLRQLLISGGMSLEDVNALTDNEILQLYQQSMSDETLTPDQLSSMVGDGASSTEGYMVPSTIDISGLQIKTLDDLKKLSGAQIKALMIKNGASEEMLNQISEDEIKQLLLEKLSASQ